MATTSKTAPAADEALAETPATPETFEAELPGAVASYTEYAPHDFEIRRAAVQLAIDAHESFPVKAAPEYYAFLTGATAAAE